MDRVPYSYPPRALSNPEAWVARPAKPAGPPTLLLERSGYVISSELP
jgi:hypothetical protein